MTIATLLKQNSIIAIAGNRSTGKTLLALQNLKELKQEYPNLNIATLGLNPVLKRPLAKLGIKFLISKMELLDLNVVDTILYVDEFALLFDTQTQSKQLDKLMRFFDRIEHLNCKLILSTAREGFYNKFMCSRVSCFLVKQIEYDSLVNGTWLKERVKAITDNTSDYRLEAEQNEYFIVGTNVQTEKRTFKYSEELDTKSNNKNLFEKTETKDEK